MEEVIAGAWERGYGELGSSFCITVHVQGAVQA